MLSELTFQMATRSSALLQLAAEKRVGFAQGDKWNNWRLRLFEILLQPSSKFPRNGAFEGA